MPKPHWTLSDLPWNSFDPSRLDPALLRLVKAAAVVEYGGDRYARYLGNIFADDASFQEAIQRWASEEIQHGEALGRYASLADPAFDFQQAYARFTAGYRLAEDVPQSIRGSRSGELVARCIVETGTSSYYTALGEATTEPLLKALCRKIANDEIRHYKLFLTALNRTLEDEKISRWHRLKIALGRLQESEDDELAYAYFSANAPPEAMYHRPTYTRAYLLNAYPLYRRSDARRMIVMLFKACGLTAPWIATRIAARAAWFLLRIKLHRAKNQAF